MPRNSRLAEPTVVRIPRQLHRFVPGAIAAILIGAAGVSVPLRGVDVIAAGMLLPVLASVVLLLFGLFLIYAAITKPRRSLIIGPDGIAYRARDDETHWTVRWDQLQDVFLEVGRNVPITGAGALLLMPKAHVVRLAMRPDFSVVSHLVELRDTVVSREEGLLRLPFGDRPKLIEPLEQALVEQSEGRYRGRLNLGNTLSRL